MILIALGFVFSLSFLHAHPGSGIAVDRQGNVYFSDTGSGIWKIDTKGKLTKILIPAYHWMTLDPDRRLEKVTLPNFSHGDALVERGSDDPSVLASSDFPITVGTDGSMFYSWLGGASQLTIYRLSPKGTTDVFKVLPAKTENGPLQWLNGLAATSDGSIYYSEHRAIRKITPHGEIVTIASRPALTGCGGVPGHEPETGPYFRGIAVDGEGNVFAAAAGCRAVVKFGKDKSVTTIVTTESPWSPTAVAVSGNDLYVLEYFHTPGDNRREWIPRVRKVSRDGKQIIIAEIKR